MITNFKKKHSQQVACLHISDIPTGFISSLGIGFVSALYEAIAEDKNSFGFVSADDDKVLGFVVFSTNLSKLYKYVILRKGFKFVFILARKMMSVQTIKKILANLCYPKKMTQMSLPEAELLSIVVAPEGRCKGLANKLIQAGLGECRKRRIEKVKVLVAAENEPANKLYQKCGFEFKLQIDSHQTISNIYIHQIN